MIERVWRLFLALYRNHAKAPGESRDATKQSYVCVLSLKNSDNLSINILLTQEINQC